MLTNKMMEDMKKAAKQVPMGFREEEWKEITLTANYQTGFRKGWLQHKFRTEDEERQRFSIDELLSRLEPEGWEKQFKQRVITRLDPGSGTQDIVEIETTAITFRKRGG